MKISLVTIIDNDLNIGTYLQAYSLAKVFERKGYEVELLDYYRKCNLPLHIARTLVSDKSNPISALLSVVYRLTTVSVSKYKLKTRFLLKHSKLSKRCYTSFEELERYPPEADIYVTGSDQVWNSQYNEGIEKAYYLAFAPQGKKKFAYAASIGMDSFPEEERIETRNLLSEYSKIGVRESSAINTLSEIGIDNAEHVVDPTLLIANEEWLEMAKADSFVKTEPYLLIYSVEYSKKTIVAEYAYGIAKKLNLKVYMVTSGGFRDDIPCDRNFHFASPERFLNLMAQADFVIASSFHGTAFSVKMNKQFLSISPNKFNLRVHSFLNTVGLTARIKQEPYCPSAPLETIDYAGVNELLSQEILKSQVFIDSMLKDTGA